MVRTYKKKTNRGEWSMVAMKTAIDKVINKEMGCKKAALLYGVPQPTLERYVKRMRTNCEETFFFPLRAKKTIFTPQEEDELVAYLKQMEERHIGLTTIELRRLAYQLAVRNDKKHNFNTDKEMAGVDWLKGFLKRHQNLSMREPEPDELEFNSEAAKMHRIEKQVIAELLEMYKNLPCLWDVTDQFYSNKVARNRAYATLVEKYKEIDSECNQQMLKKKIENLRTTYRRERQKVIKSKFRNGERYKPHLWYYPLFSFLEQLEHSSDEDSMQHESPEPTQLIPDTMVTTEIVVENERLLEIEPTKEETNETNEGDNNSSDMLKLEDIVPETVRATESILQNYEEDIGIMTEDPEPETKYRPAKRPKPRAVYIPEAEYDYESETTSTTKRRNKNKSKIDSTAIVIEDDDDLSRSVEFGHSSCDENDLFAKTMSAQLGELRPKQRFIAQKLMSEVIFFGRLDKLKTETKLHLDGD